MATSTPRSRSRAFRLVALLSCALLSCTTIRTHVSYMPGDVVVGEDGHAVPQIDLWVESNKPLSPEEEARYSADVRKALEDALAVQGQPEGDTILVLRSQGITRTPARRSDQAGAVAGLVVGAVVVIAAVVLIVVAGAKDGGHSHAPSLPSPGGHSARAPDRIAPPRTGIAPPRFSPAPRPVASVTPPRPSPPPLPAPRPGPGRAVPPPHFPGAPPVPVGHHHHDGGVAVGVDVDVWLPLEPEPAPPPPAWAYPPPPGELPPGELAASPGEAEPPPPERRPIWVAPPDPFPVDDRGFFDGDRLEIEALVIDRQTGQVLWTKRVSRDADPRDAKAVRSAVDELLKEGGWLPPAPPGS